MKIILPVMLLVLLSGCTTTSTLVVQGNLPMIKWIAEKAVSYHECGSVRKEERTVKTARVHGETHVYVRHVCVR